MPNPTPTPNSPDRNELRADFRRYLKLGLGPLLVLDKLALRDDDSTEKLYSSIVEANMLAVDAHMNALQQTIEAGLPGKLNMDDAMLNYGWTDEEYIAWNKALRMCRSAITKAFEAAKAGKDSK